MPELEADEPVVVTPPEKDTWVPLTRAATEALQRERDESRASERYWADTARSRSGPAADAAPEPEDVDTSEFLDAEDAAADDDTPEKLVNDLASKGASALKARGYITKADAQKLAADVAVKVAREMISRQGQRDRSDTAIMGEFPEL